MTDFDLTAVRQIIDSGNAHHVWHVAHRLATDVAARDASIDALHKDVAMLRRLLGVDQTAEAKAWINHQINAARKGIDPHGDITPDELVRPLLDDIDLRDQALALLVALVDRAHVSDAGHGLPPAGIRCHPACRACIELAALNAIDPHLLRNARHAQPARTQGETR